MDFLEETVSALSDIGKTPEDVLWVGSADGELAIDWATFASHAEGLYYDSGYGAQEIARDLVVAGNGWWLARVEYDGSEWWSAQVPPIKKEDAGTFGRKALCVSRDEIGWVSLGRE